MSEGFRGYIVSAPVRGSHVPQRIQNLVVRDYAQRRALPYRLSLTEYAMPGSSMMLASLLDDLESVDGIILFSLFTLPRGSARRQAVFERIVATGKALHAALEQLELRTLADAGMWNDLLDIDATLPSTPFGGRYEKDDNPLGRDSDVALEAFGLTPESPDA